MKNIATPRHFTLNIRLTKGCNADCSYCSSWVGNPKRMTVDEYKQSLEFLLTDYFPRLDIFPNQNKHISIQYVGGELLTVPLSDMRDIVYHNRSELAKIFSDITDGAQTNLIGSWQKVRAFMNIFSGRVSTSVDNFTGARTVAGSTEKYRDIFNGNDTKVKAKRKRSLPAIIVVERGSMPFLSQEVEKAEVGNRDLTLRAVFSGGKDISGIALSPAELAESFGGLFDKWVMNSSIAIEPFARLLAGRLIELGDSTLISAYGGCSGCPFQSDCARVSLNLEPNGDLYICLDTADSNYLKLGNALRREFDWDLWLKIDQRKHQLDDKCRKCPWVSTCHGGCLSESMEAGLGILGRTPLCLVWTTLFEKIDAVINKCGVDIVADWLRNTLGIKS